MTERTTLEIHDGIAWITMDDGKVNAMSVEMLEEVASRLDAAETKGAVTVLAGREGDIFGGLRYGYVQAWSRGDTAHGERRHPAY